MAKYRVSYEIDVDESALAEHDSDASPPPSVIEEWYDTDIHAAVEKGIAEIDHAPADVERVDE